MNVKHVFIIVFVNVVFTIALFRLQAAELQNTVTLRESGPRASGLDASEDGEKVKALQAEIDLLKSKLAAVSSVEAAAPVAVRSMPAAGDTERRQRTVARVTQHIHAMQTGIHDYANAKYLVYGESGVGVGNRFNAIITTMLMAIASKRVFLLQGTDFMTEFINEFRPSYEWYIPEFDKKFTAEQRKSHILLRFECCNGSNKTLIDSLADRPHFLNLDMSEGTVFNQIACHDWAATYADKKFISFRTNQYLAVMAMNNPHYAKEMNELFDGFEPFSIIAQSLLVLRPELQEFIDRFRPKHRFDEHFTLGVQLRFGLFRTSAGDQLTKAGKFLQCADKINHDRVLDGVDSRPLKIFACGDNPEKLALLKQQYPELDIVSLQPEDMKPFPNFTMLNYKLSEDQLYRLLDIWMLGECEDLLLSDLSTFGTVASGKRALKPAVMLTEGLCVRRLRSEPCNTYAWALPHQSCYKDVKAYQRDWGLCQTDYFRSDPWVKPG
eukprot:TRINITY_DN15878_c0_g1_i1.p1 TRINITY_DN15878_c0_g1~~TRINITY_DN15878_c0_g1_i1.p1  ORF type:complete len:495 (-),score=159.62 TRINITY_DN15878_c0_g1_i1:101-1585(-)